MRFGRRSLLLSAVAILTVAGLAWSTPAVVGAGFIASSVMALWTQTGVQSGDGRVVLAFAVPVAHLRRPYYVEAAPTVMAACLWTAAAKAAIRGCTHVASDDSSG